MDQQVGQTEKWLASAMLDAGPISWMPLLGSNTKRATQHTIFFQLCRFAFFFFLRSRSEISQRRYRLEQKIKKNRCTIYDDHNFCTGQVSVWKKPVCLYACKRRRYNFIFCRRRMRHIKINIALKITFFELFCEYVMNGRPNRL